MNKLSLLAATLLLSTSLYAEHEHEEKSIIADRGEIEIVDTKSLFENVNFQVLIEERIQPKQSRKGTDYGFDSRTLLKFQADTMITDKLSLWGAIWLRDKQSDNNSQYIDYVDMYAGMSYSVHKYFSPYFFFERYYDKWMPANNATGKIDHWGSFFALGFSGSLYSQGRHSIGYYTEWYYSMEMNGYTGQGNVENFNLWSTESAIKYSFKIYENTTLYVQPVWNTNQYDDVEKGGYLGTHGYTDGYYSTRFGIQVGF